jgi:hypothetical protein
VARYQGKVSRIYFRADAAFAMPEVYQFLEAERIKYAIRLPANQVLQSRIGYLLTRPVGRRPHPVRRFHANFSYQAGTWTKSRRVVAKVEWHPGELYPRVGFIVTNMSRQPERVVAFYNKRGTCEQWIKKGKGAIPDGRSRHRTANVPRDFAAHRGATAAATTSASVRRSMSCTQEQPTEGARPNAALPAASGTTPVPPEPGPSPTVSKKFVADFGAPTDGLTSANAALNRWKQFGQANPGAELVIEAGKYQFPKGFAPLDGCVNSTITGAGSGMTELVMGTTAGMFIGTANTMPQCAAVLCRLPLSMRERPR